MRKVTYMALSLAFMFLFLYGCQPKENISKEANANSSPKSENSQQLSLNNDFKSVSITKPKGFNKITFDDKESLKAFQDIFSNAVREPGEVNIADPEFYMDVIYDKNNQQRIYLWIGKKGQKSTFMKLEDTSTIYTFSNDMTDKLIELVESRFN
ncbi:hypothetical protein [Mesobacillus jeotgali]|uniref:hypothetical protein n=1 Tax=Mesobacillus jeotgali TaxID=129985 RepID=UPI001CFC523D|nr:hypothetical protein [Mesobacillus jeotgali]